MKCNVLEAEKKKWKKRLAIFSICLIIIIVIVLFIIFHKDISNYLNNDNINTIILAITLITTIICFNKGKKNDIIIHKKIRDQEKFESEIDNILSFYPQVIQDYINSLFDINKDHIEEDELQKGNCVFERTCLDRYNTFIAKHSCEIISINNRIVYLYKYHEVNHPEFDKFKIKVLDMNNTINNEIYNLSELLKELLSCHNIARANDLISQRDMCVNNIRIVYQDNIAELYMLANNCIEERANISIKY